MPEAILGLSAYYHDSAAVVLIDGDIAAAAHEERFTRKKHDSSFPLNSARYVLNESGFDLGDLTAVSFKEKTGCGLLVNTSFNVRGEPIFCTPKDAYKCFMRTEMDYLVMESLLFDKSRQPNLREKQDWRTEYELD
jgi:predicted NodU family carbamoyl transferase